MESVTTRPACFSIWLSRKDLSMIAFEDQAQPLQRQELVNFLDSLGLRRNQARKAAGRDDMDILAALLANPLDQAVHQRGIAENQPGLDGCDSGPSDGFFRARQFDVIELRCMLNQRVH